MIAWMLYALMVGLVLAVAAFMVERAAKDRGASTRWPWLASLLGSLVMPVIIAFASIRLPGSAADGRASAPLLLSDATSIRTPLTQLHLDHSPVYGLSISADQVAVDLWMAASACMALMLVLGVFWVARRRRGWRDGTLHGERVCITPDTGPAVIGLLRPQIVVPEWLLTMSKAQQAYALAHECSHREARDPLLIAFALGLLTLMPWNVALWWQFHRLRRAIEIDCDARVLQDGGDVSAYCETLLHVGQQKSRHIPLLPAMSDSASFLELRMRQMLRKPRRGVRESAAVLICLSIGMAVFAAQITPPDVHRAGNLNRYIGFYQVSPVSLVEVTQADGALSVRITGQMAAPKPFRLVGAGHDQFTVQGNDALAVRFVMDGSGYAVRLVATQGGRIILDRPRIDDVTAHRINEALAARIKAQKPFPGSEKALRLLLSDPDSGAGMSPELAFERQQQKAARESYLARIGAVQSFTFTGVNEFGADTYRVVRTNGDETIMLVVDADGTLANAVRYSPMASPPDT
ncbi:M56 family metallopeptidase [Luteibacter aegosomatissinici]|uniref:M56 family metallopeptidase n=1 Tax=Luteibacter aegosomatissinici TaxID=2911539 RepID=UPI001FFB3BF9|nr:M56 family metallopeptidase [Luteibacter aegosomatissinici]UPG93865.1 M56 family metallopeptidase [Luteibacter aegosomatissinici]